MDLEEKKRKNEIEAKQAMLNEFEKTQTSMLDKRIPFSPNTSSTNKDNSNKNSSESSSTSQQSNGKTYIYYLFINKINK